jgi:cytochrome d ubiquinol oxidase subunit II
MALEDVVAAYGMLAVILYGALGGADFGGGVWDLFASGPRRNEQRRVIAQAMGPVWEANHVWLIFIIVVLFTAFPQGFYILCVTLFVPFHLVLIGVTLRGAAFVFRGPKVGDPATIHWSYVFGIASVVSPVFLGMTMGAVSAGNLRWVDNEVRVEGVSPWLSPVALAMGGFAMALCAYLAAVFLTQEATGELQEDFRRRAFIAAAVVAAFAVLTLPVVYFDAPHLWEGLLHVKALPVFIAGWGAMFLSGWSLWKRHFRLARAATVAQTAFLLLGWGLAQYPYLIYPDVTLAGAATSRGTLLFLAVTVPLGLMVLVPSLWFLFRVFKGETFESRK